MGEALAQPFVKAVPRRGRQAGRRADGGGHRDVDEERPRRAVVDGRPDAHARPRRSSRRSLNKIGFPAKWRSYDGLTVSRASLLGERRRAAAAFEAKRELAKVGQAGRQGRVGDDAADRQRVLRAHDERDGVPGGHPAAAVLCGDADPGDELRRHRHRSWATSSRTGSTTRAGSSTPTATCATGGSPPVGAEFDRRAACVEKQFDDYVAVDDVHVKGKLTLGENIADLGGLKLVVRRVRARREGAPGDAADRRRLHPRAAVLPRLRPGLVHQHPAGERAPAAWPPTRTRRRSTASTARCRTCPSSRRRSSARRAADGRARRTSGARSGEAARRMVERARCATANRPSSVADADDSL